MPSRFFELPLAVTFTVWARRSRSSVNPLRVSLNVSLPVLSPAIVPLAAPTMTVRLRAAAALEPVS